MQKNCKHGISTSFDYKLDNIVGICNHHFNQYIREYFKQIKKCIDSFASHKVTVKTTLHEVTLD